MLGEIGHDRLGVSLLEGLGARSDDLSLLAWEGRAFFAEAARLLKRSLLRLDDGATPEGLARARLFAPDPAAGLDGEGGLD